MSGFPAAFMVIILLLLPFSAGAAAEAEDLLAGVGLEGLGYFDYSAGERPREGGGTQEYNRFALTRAYFTVRKQATDWLSFRVTMDLSQQADGDYLRREKYYYAELRPRASGPLTELRSEIGMGHMPWLDFEEHINPYRAQGTMAVERAGIFNSADLGVSLRGHFGAELADARERTGSTSYAGRWGSWHLGVYNGGGYHAVEPNRNKALEGRLTLRPLPDLLPGLQLSYFGLRGEGNSPEADRPGEFPDYQVHLGMLSFQVPGLTLTAQAFTTEGNARGSYVVPDTLPAGQPRPGGVAGRPLETLGASLFADWRPPVMDRRWRLFARWDRFDVDRDDLLADETAYDLVILGTAVEIHPRNLLILAFESVSFEADAPLRGAVPLDHDPERPRLEDDWKVQAVYQLAF